MAVTSLALSPGPRTLPGAGHPPQGHFRSLRADHVPAGLHSSTICFTPDQERGHGQILRTAAEQGPKADHELLSLGLGFGHWQGKPQRSFQRKLLGSPIRLSPAWENCAVSEGF